MPSRSEQVKLRLLEILEEVAPSLVEPVSAEHVMRNEAPQDNDDTPALILLDGRMRMVKPVRITGTKSGMISRTLNRKGIASLQPSLWYIAKMRESEDQSELGPLLSDAEIAIHNGVTRDAELLALLTTNGWMEYLGHETDMQTGNLLSGELRLDFSFVFPLDPGELV